MELDSKKPNDDDVAIVLQARIVPPMTEVVTTLRERGYRDSEMVREGLRCLAAREHIVLSKPPGAKA